MHAGDGHESGHDPRDPEIDFLQPNIAAAAKAAAVEVAFAAASAPPVAIPAAVVPAAAAAKLRTQMEDSKLQHNKGSGNYSEKNGNRAISS